MYRGEQVQGKLVLNFLFGELFHRPDYRPAGVVNDDIAIGVLFAIAGRLA